MSATKPSEEKVTEPSQNASGLSDPGSKATESGHDGSPSSSSDTIAAKSSENQTSAVASEEKARSSKSSPVGRGGYYFTRPVEQTTDPELLSIGLKARGRLRGCAKIDDSLFPG
jgi:hypothetical protein